MVKFLTSCVTKSFVEPDTFYVWPLNKNIPGWIGKNELYVLNYQNGFKSFLKSIYLGVELTTLHAFWMELV